MKRRGGGQQQKRGGGRKHNIRGGKLQKKNGEPIYSEKMGRKLKADEVAVLAREVERLSEKERNLLEREKRVKDWENAAHVRNSGEPARPKGDSRAQNLWKKAREGMKPATLSEKLRNAFRE